MGTLKDGDLFLINRKDGDTWTPYTISYNTLADNIDTDTIADPVVWKASVSGGVGTENHVTGFNAESGGSYVTTVKDIKRFVFHNSIPTVKVQENEAFQVYNSTQSKTATYKATANGTNNGTIGEVKVEYQPTTAADEFSFAVDDVLEFRTLGGGGLDVGDISLSGGLEIDSSTGQLQVKVKPDSGLVTGSEGLAAVADSANGITIGPSGIGVKVKSDSGLSTVSDGIVAVTYDTYGITSRGSSGIAFSDDWSAIPPLT